MISGCVLNIVYISVPTASWYGILDMHAMLVVDWGQSCYNKQTAESIGVLTGFKFSSP